MAWRRWSIIVVLILANYLVFSTLATLVFPATPPGVPTHVAKPTFTPGGQQLQRVDPPTYDFLTPTATATATVTATLSTVTPTLRITITPTGSP